VLPRAAGHLRDRLLQPGVRIGDDQLHSGEAALDERAQKAAQKRFRLRLADVTRG
jgi:hypothetical protein